MPPPLNPRPIVSLLERSDTRAVQPITNQPVKVVTANPMRVGFVVFSEIPTVGTLLLSPDPTGTYGVQPKTGQTHVSITFDEFPLLTQLEWYIISRTAGPSLIYVIEYLRNSGG